MEAPPTVEAAIAPDRRAINTLELSGIENMRRNDHVAAEKDLTAALERRGQAHPGQADHQFMSSAINNLAEIKERTGMDQPTVIT